MCRVVNVGFASRGLLWLNAFLEETVAAVACSVCSVSVEFVSVCVLPQSQWFFLCVLFRVPCVLVFQHSFVRIFSFRWV